MGVLADHVAGFLDVHPNADTHPSAESFKTSFLDAVHPSSIGSSLGAVHPNVERAMTAAESFVDTIQNNLVTNDPRLKHRNNVVSNEHSKRHRTSFPSPTVETMRTLTGVDARDDRAASLVDRAAAEHDRYDTCQDPRLGKDGEDFWNFQGRKWSKFAEGCFENEETSSVKTVKLVSKDIPLAQRFGKCSVAQIPNWFIETEIKPRVDYDIFLVPKASVNRVEFRNQARAMMMELARPNHESVMPAVWRRDAFRFEEQKGEFMSNAHNAEILDKLSVTQRKSFTQCKKAWEHRVRELEAKESDMIPPLKDDIPPYWVKSIFDDTIHEVQIEDKAKTSCDVPDLKFAKNLIPRTYWYESGEEALNTHAGLNDMIRKKEANLQNADSVGDDSELQTVMKDVMDIVKPGKTSRASMSSKRGSVQINNVLSKNYKECEALERKLETALQSDDDTSRAKKFSFRWKKQHQYPISTNEDVKNFFSCRTDTYKTNLTDCNMMDFNNDAVSGSLTLQNVVLKMPVTEVRAEDTQNPESTKKSWVTEPVDVSDGKGDHVIFNLKTTGEEGKTIPVINVGSPETRVHWDTDYKNIVNAKENLACMLEKIRGPQHVPNLMQFYELMKEVNGVEVKVIKPKPRVSRLDIELEDLEGPLYTARREKHKKNPYRAFKIYSEEPKRLPKVPIGPGSNITLADLVESGRIFKDHSLVFAFRRSALETKVNPFIPGSILYGDGNLVEERKTGKPALDKGKYYLSGRPRPLVLTIPKQKMRGNGGSEGAQAALAVGASVALATDTASALSSPSEGAAVSALASILSGIKAAVTPRSISKKRTPVYYDPAAHTWWGPNAFWYNGEPKQFDDPNFGVEYDGRLRSHEKDPVMYPHVTRRRLECGCRTDDEWSCPDMLIDTISDRKCSNGEYYSGRKKLNPIIEEKNGDSRIDREMTDEDIDQDELDEEDGAVCPWTAVRLGVRTFCKEGMPSYGECTKGMRQCEKEHASARECRYPWCKYSELTGECSTGDLAEEIQQESRLRMFPSHKRYADMF